MKKIATLAKHASHNLLSLDHQTRAVVLKKIASALKTHKQKIINANKKDIEHAYNTQLSEAMIDRLILDQKRLETMIQGVEEIASQKDVVHEFLDEHQNSDGLIIKKQRIPIGVILMIFESRPGVIVDTAALAIKSSNAVILKGGKEAKYSNEILGEIIQEAIAPYLPKETIQVLASDKRELIHELLSLNEFIDLVIPRGGEKLVRYVYEHSKIPVIAHFRGLCHIYIDKDADNQKAIDVIVNAKTQRPGVCNAVETVLLHREKLAIAEQLFNTLLNTGTQLRVDPLIFEHIKSLKLKSAKDQIIPATAEDWSTEYLDNILAVKIVEDLKQALVHIQEYGTNHSEAIITENKSAYDEFLNKVDASCVMWNASTRFNDGGQLGLGAELGISTSKIHAYGPMGAKEMTTTRFVVIGNGHIRN